MYLLLADVEIKFGRPVDALNMLTEARSKIKHLTAQQDYVFKKCEAEALITTQIEDNVEKAAQICEKVRLADFALYSKKV